MSETDNKKAAAEKAQAEKKAAAEKMAREKQAQLENKEKSKKILERARRIHAARKADEARKASEERKVRMTRRAEERKKIEEAKKKAMENKSKTAVTKTESKDSSEPQFIDFAVTARKYKTQLTKKYMNRKFWENPSPFEIQSYIPGTIISVDVKEGKIVEEGTQLLILEAMKMQNKVDMPFTARIKKINVKPGERIPKDFIMVELESVEK